MPYFRSPVRVALLLAAVVAPAWATQASAQTITVTVPEGQGAQPAPPPPPPPPGYYYATQQPAQPAQSGGYIAPMSQTTQPSYVPQSVALSGPRRLDDWDAQEPVPPGYHTKQTIRKKLVIAGVSTFVPLYLLSALTAAVGSDTNPGGPNPVAAMWVPGIGPFIQMASTSSATANVFLALDGLGQTGGLVMFIYGLAVPKTVLVRNDLGENKLDLTVVPLAAGGATGATLVGHF